MTNRPLRIATRGSALALWQANHVRDLLMSRGHACELVEVSTIGDRDRSTPLANLAEASFGGTGEATQGVFTKEVQRVVLDGDADLAVHSLKDLPTEPAANLLLAAVPKRAHTGDALILPREAKATSLGELPQGARIGTGSPRRQAQLLYVRPDVRPAEIRGNVETRLSKLDDGEYDAIILAEAGLHRLGLADRISLPLRPPAMWHAVSQGALGLECRTDDEQAASALAALIDPAATACVTAERSLLRTLRAGCGAAVGVRSRFVDGRTHLEAVVLDLAGTQRLRAAGASSDAAALGERVAGELLAGGAAELIA